MFSIFFQILIVVEKKNNTTRIELDGVFAVCSGLIVNKFRHERHIKSQAERIGDNENKNHEPSWRS